MQTAFTLKPQWYNGESILIKRYRGSKNQQNERKSGRDWGT